MQKCPSATCSVQYIKELTGFVMCFTRTQVFLPPAGSLTPQRVVRPATCTAYSTFYRSTGANTCTHYRLNTRCDRHRNLNLHLSNKLLNNNNWKAPSEFKHLSRIFTFYPWLFTRIALVNKERFKIFLHEPDDRHQHLIDCFLGHAPPLHNFINIRS